MLHVKHNKNRIRQNKTNLGVIGEDIAKKYLKNKGFSIIMSNFKTFHGEIDIIASKNEEVYFVEVKSISISRVTPTSIGPRDNFTHAKSRNFEKAISYYLMTHPSVALFKTLLICLYIDTEHKTARVRYIENPTL